MRDLSITIGIILAHARPFYHIRNHSITCETFLSHQEPTCHIQVLSDTSWLLHSHTGSIVAKGSFLNIMALALAYGINSRKGIILKHHGSCVFGLQHKKALVLLNIVPRKRVICKRLIKIISIFDAKLQEKMSLAGFTTYIQRSALLTMLLLLIHSQGSCQLKTYLSLEAGPSWDINRIQDAGNFFSPARIPGTIQGISLWQEIMPNLSIGTGAYYHIFATGINPTDQRPHQPATQLFSALLIPARISFRIGFPDFPISLSPAIGYQYGRLLNTFESQNIASLITSPEGVTLSYTVPESAPVRQTANLVEAGLSADYRFPNNWQLSLAYTYTSGLQDLNFSTVEYSNGNGLDNQANYSDDGSRSQVTFCLGIPVSNLWENSDVRLHRKIESSRSRGASVKTDRYMYIGGDLDALWRTFSTTNPAIGPKPVDGYGPFRFANLHTGGYVGFLFNSSAGMDIGVYYQRSGYFFSVMYDYETDYSFLDKAPLFLEVPVMFRFFADLWKERLFLVPKVGFSAITHFSSGPVADGEGIFEYSGGSGTLNYSASRVSPFGFSVKAGIGMEYKLPIGMPLLATINLLYSHGIMAIDQIAITTSINESPSSNYITWSGSGWNSSIGLRMPILLGASKRKCGALPMR